MLGAALALAGLLGAVSCNDDAAKDDPAKQATTTTEGGPTTTVAVTAPPESAPLITVTTTTLSPTQFSSTLDIVRTDLAGAGTDLCKVIAAAQALQTAGSPSTTDEIKSLFVLYGEVFNKIADALPAESDDDAATIRAAVVDMLAKAEAAGYDPQSFSGGGPPGLVDNPEMVAAMSRVQGLVNDCPKGG